MSAVAVRLRGVHIGEFADQLVGIVDPCFGLGGAGLRTAAQPFLLHANAILKCLLPLALCIQVILFLFQKCAVVSR